MNLAYEISRSLAYEDLNPALPGRVDLIVFLICIDVEVRSGLQKEIAQKGETKRCPVKNNIAHLQWMETPPKAPTAWHRRTQQRQKRTSNRCEIESTCTFSRNEQPSSLESACQVA